MSRNRIFMEPIFFQNWESILRTLIITVLAYFALVVMLRASGKRTLSKMNAFDFIITVALGSTLANVSLNKDITLAEGALALFLLVGLQYLITWLSVRVNFVKSLITSTPALLFYKGEILDDVMKKERVTMEEIKSKARERGIASLDEIDAIVLETTGSITIIPSIQGQKMETLENVKHFDRIKRFLEEPLEQKKNRIS
jgi:uncharacterized membrane protein YcaP (DUF421 family)